MERAQALLETLAGPEARLRPDQAAAIDAVVGQKRRTLVVQRTGFGKSAIYFIATKLLREQGAGPTLLVSPLLALMRDQVAAAARMGVRSETINSTNPDDWSAIEDAVSADQIDLLCISPERLNSAGFARRVLPSLSARLGLLVVDEAHCISDWGHDFRPDYRRIRDALRALVPGTPVIATTATANARVCEDVADQLGDDVLVLRGSLDRPSLVLGVAPLPDLAHRLAWISERVAAAPGTGIVYCLTVAQTEHVAGFLQSRGIDARAYSSESENREALEADFKANRVKALVATSALGMGVDKPDVAFVHHLGAPPSPIAYYQQVGRAGRSLERAEAWLLPGSEDRAIWGWFESVGLPSEPLVRRVLDAFVDEEPASLPALERIVDLRRTRLETLLKILDVEGAVCRVEGGWVRTGREYVYDEERVERVKAARAAEAAAMERYASSDACLMELLRGSLDDPGAERCGRCAVCVSVSVDAPAPDVVRAAVEFLRGLDVVLEPRRQWPRGLDEPRGNIKPAQRASAGRALCREGDAGWWPAVCAGEDLEAGVVALLRRWNWDERPAWVTWIPSSSSDVPEQLARRIASIGRLPVHAAVERVRPGRPQSTLQNAAHLCRNVWGAFRVSPVSLAGPVLLVDDTYDSGWTMTVVADALLSAGSGSVLPFVLTKR